MDEREKQALGALAAMVEQYLDIAYEANGEFWIDNYAMSAGENAMQVLAAYGYMELDGSGRFGRWTDAGKALQAWKYTRDEQKYKSFPEPPVPVRR